MCSRRYSVGVSPYRPLKRREKCAWFANAQRPSIYYQDVRIQDGGNYDLMFSDPSNGQFNIAHSQRLPSDDPNVIAAIKLDAQRGDYAISSVTSNYTRRVTWETDYTQYQDNAFFGDPWPLTSTDYGTGFYETYQNATSEELRVSSSDFDSRLTWVGGVYWEHARQEDSVYVVHPDLPDLVQNIYGQSITAILGAPPYLGKFVAYDDVFTTDDQTALFGNLDFKILPTLKASAGVRVAYATSHTFLHFDGSFNGGPGFFSGNEIDKPVTPKADLTWQPTDDTTYYVSAAKGYRVGGVNPQINNTQAACQVALAADDLDGKLSRTYNPDSLWSYEIGAKGKFLDNRLDFQLSGYHIKWSDIQQAAQITGCGFAAVFNLGSATSNGFDLSLRAAATDNLHLNLQIAYTDATYDGSRRSGTQVTSTGRSVPTRRFTQPSATASTAPTWHTTRAAPGAQCISRTAQALPWSPVRSASWTAPIQVTAFLSLTGLRGNGPVPALQGPDKCFTNWSSAGRPSCHNVYEPTGNSLGSLTVNSWPVAISLSVSRSVA